VSRAATLTIRRLEAHEWKLLRELRLRALRDAPDAFGPLAADVEREPDAYWQRFAQVFRPERGDLLVALADGRGVGLVSAIARDGFGHVGAMWVDPAARGAGLGRRLLEAACAALRARGCWRILLDVTDTNAPAIALYRSAGFELTGGAKPLRDGSTLRNLEMAREA
jgi:ribosomal protein S18 acetylase RimI-like enzyme